MYRYKSDVRIHWLYKEPALNETNFDALNIFFAQMNCEKFRFISCLGEGAFGIVYQAINLQTDKVSSFAIEDIFSFSPSFQSLESCSQMYQNKSSTWCTRKYETGSKHSLKA